MSQFLDSSVDVDVTCWAPAHSTPLFLWLPILKLRFPTLVVEDLFNIRSFSEVVILGLSQLTTPNKHWNGMPCPQEVNTIDSWSPGPQHKLKSTAAPPDYAVLFI